MKKKYYILAVIFLCMLCTNTSYGLEVNEGEEDEFVQPPPPKEPEIKPKHDLKEVIIINDPCNPASNNYDLCKCDPRNCDDYDSGDCTDPSSFAFPCDSGDCSDISSAAFPCDSGDCTDPFSMAYPCDNDNNSGCKTRICPIGYERSGCECIKKSDDCKESMKNTVVPGNSKTFQKGDTITFNGPFYFADLNKIPKNIFSSTGSNNADVVVGYQVIEHGNYYEVPSLSFKYNVFSNNFNGGKLGGFTGKNCSDAVPQPIDPNFDETDYGNSGSFEKPELKNWYIDQDKDGFESTSEKAENSPGGEYIEGISKGKDCDDTIWNADNINCNLKKPWYLDNDNDAWHSQAKQAEISPGANWKETTSGVDCNDARYSLENDCSLADPCAEIKNILNYEAPDPNTKDLKPNINRLEDVVKAAVNDREEGFEISKRMNADETYRYEFDIAKPGLEYEIEMQTAGPIIGTFHSHPSKGIAMFSFQDFRHLTNLYNRAKTQHKQDVFEGLVAKDEQGNTNVYILKVDDIAKLQKLVDDTWGNPDYADYTTDKERRDAIHLVQEREYAKESDKEKSFLKQFPAAGISIYKADTTLGNFSKLTLTNDKVAKTPCN